MEDWTDPRYKQVAADIQARKEAEAKAGLPERPLRGFIVPTPEG
ncbi:hypothetical protein [Streptomyces sp. 8N706]